MKEAHYIKKIIAERGQNFYNENKSLLRAQYEYIESLGDKDDIKGTHKMTVGELMGLMTEKPVYLLNDQEKIVIRSTPGKTYARQSGGKEYEVNDTSNLVMTAIIAGRVITRKEYLNF